MHASCPGILLKYGSYLGESGVRLPGHPELPLRVTLPAQSSYYVCVALSSGSSLKLTPEELLLLMPLLNLGILPGIFQ